MGPLRIGLTGNIACGKSAVAQVLVERGFIHLDTDQLAREVVAPGSEGLARIVSAFGPGVLTPEGALDRGALGRLVFADETARQRLNAITHPLIGQLLLARMAAAQGPVVASVPLLFEANMQGLFDEVWLVCADEETQLKRLMARDGLSEQAARARMASQWPLVQKIPLSREVFDNNGALEELRANVLSRLETRGL